MNTRSTPCRAVAAYIPTAALAVVATVLVAAGWPLAALACAGASGITYAGARARWYLRTTPATPPAPADGSGLHADDAAALHARYAAAIATEQDRQAQEGIHPHSPESADCLAAAILADRDPVLVEALSWARNTETHVNRLTAQVGLLNGSVRTSNSAWRQASNLARMWDAAEGPDAPGLNRAAADLREILRSTA
ncbi:hypothetical protein [Streptomyces niveus]|uniref:hypothetical protein n=1 Tax=Streptomyces niveus TaxID=193462 RepID=UPI0036AFC673